VCASVLQAGLWQTKTRINCQHAVIRLVLLRDLSRGDTQLLRVLLGHALILLLDLSGGYTQLPVLAGKWISLLLGRCPNQVFHQQSRCTHQSRSRNKRFVLANRTTAYRPAGKALFPTAEVFAGRRSGEPNRRTGPLFIGRLSSYGAGAPATVDIRP